MNRWRWALVALVAWGSLLTVARASRTTDEADPVRILDRSLQPVYEAGFEVVPNSRVGDGGRTAMVGFDGFWQFAYFQNVLQSDLDLNLDSELIFLTDSAGARLPGQVGAFVLDAGATWRLINGMSLEARVRPGFYTDLESLGSDAFRMPFSGVVRGPLNPHLAGMLGLEIRPSFERTVMPVIGLGWRIHPRLLLKAALPESRLTYYATHALTVYGGLDWSSTTYALSESGANGRNDLTIEDFRLYGGFGFALNGERHLGLELGEAFDRSFEFDRSRGGIDRDLSVDNAIYGRLVLRGPF